MTVSTQQVQDERLRHLLFMGNPKLWSLWPFLPLVRRKPGQEEELGVLYDQISLKNQTGHSSTVYLTNLFLLPAKEAEFLALPKEVYDSPDEIYAAGWRVD